MERRFYQVFRKSILAFIVWLGILTALLFCSCTLHELKSDPFNSYFFYVLQLPFYFLVLFGCKGLISIGYHLFTLGNYPYTSHYITAGECNEAHVELVGQIEKAKADLRKKGLKI